MERIKFLEQLCSSNYYVYIYVEDKIMYSIKHLFCSKLSEIRSFRNSLLDIFHKEISLLSEKSNEAFCCFKLIRENSKRTVWA